LINETWYKTVRGFSQSVNTIDCFETLRLVRLGFDLLLSNEGIKVRPFFQAAGAKVTMQEPIC
jgi:hypothetical protein